MIPDEAQTIDLRLFDGGEGGETAPASGAPDGGAQSAGETEDRTRAFRALIRGEYREQYAAETQKLINRRFRETEALRQRLGALEKAAEGFARRRGLDPADTQSLIRALGASEGAEAPDAHAAAEAAAEAKPGRAAETAQAADAADAAAAARKAAAAAEAEAKSRRANAENAAARAHAFALDRSAKWSAQAEECARKNPGFDLHAMCADPTFRLLLTNGADVERAWQAATVRERMAEAAAAAEKAVADNIRARGARPQEAGAGMPRQSLRPDASRLSDSEVLDVIARLDRRERVSFS